MGPRARKTTEAARLLDLAYDAIFAIEAGSHRITYWNAGAERMYGYSRKEALGQVSRTLLKTRYPKSSESAYEQVARAGQWEGRLVQTRKDGREILVDGRWVLDTTTAIVMEVNREVTEHVASAERFELLVGSVEDYAIFALDPDGKVVTWNEGARRIKGYEAGEIIGKHFSIFYPTEDVEAGKPAAELEQAILHGRTEDEGWRIRKDGTRFFATVVITALRDPSGTLSGFAKVTRDVTGKQLERERLLELERSKSTFLNLVAHELRSPLTVLRGYLSMFRGADDETRRALEIRSLPVLEAKTVEMTRLVDQMVEVARLEEGSLEIRAARIDLSAIAAQAVETARLLADTPHRVVLERFPGELNVDADEDRVGIILGNLLSNAIKYSPGGGETTVTLERAGGFGAVTVTDHGIGIPLEDQVRLFNRFMRVERTTMRHVAGTGMGLHLSRELARRQGGDVLMVRSGPDGSAFSLRLPLARD